MLLLMPRCNLSRRRTPHERRQRGKVVRETAATARWDVTPSGNGQMVVARDDEAVVRICVLVVDAVGIIMCVVVVVLVMTIPAIALVSVHASTASRRRRVVIR